MIMRMEAVCWHVYDHPEHSLPNHSACPASFVSHLVRRGLEGLWTTDGGCAPTSVWRLLQASPWATVARVCVVGRSPPRACSSTGSSLTNPGAHPSDWSTKEPLTGSADNDKSWTGWQAAWSALRPAAGGVGEAQSDRRKTGAAGSRLHAERLRDDARTGRRQSASSVPVQLVASPVFVAAAAAAAAAAATSS